MPKGELESARKNIARHSVLEWNVHETFDYKGSAIIATARQINPPPNEVWRPLYRINGKDQSQAWTPRDRNVIFATEKTAIVEASKRAQWLIDNSSSAASE